MIKIKGLIFAGSYIQYNNYIKKHKLNTKAYRYAYGNIDYSQHPKIRLICIGSYWLNPKYQDIKTIKLITTSEVEYE